MTSFEIPDGPTTVPLMSHSVQGKPVRIATVSFTVTNKAAERLSCRLKAAPQADAQAEWFEVQGEKERPFAPGETQKVVVNVTVPAEVPSGDFKFRLQAMNVNDPGNDYAESAVATLSTPATPAPKKGAVWPYILVAVVLVLIVGGVGTFLLWPKGGGDTNDASNGAANSATNEASTNALTPLPDVSSGQSLTFQAAYKALADAGFTVASKVVKIVSEKGPYNVVVGQSPQAHTLQPANTAVTLIMQVAPDTETYNQPQINVPGTGLVSLDWCYTFAAQCGKPAAEAFCRSKDPTKPYSSDFTINHASGRTAVISDNRICEPTCDSFDHITCTAQPSP